MSDAGMDEKPLRFIENAECSRILTEWHKSLSGDKGDRAALARAIVFGKVLEVRQFAVLRHQLAEARYKVRRPKETAALAHVAMVAAHVDPGKLSDLRIGAWLATPVRTGHNAVHEARVRLLLGSGEVPPLVRLLRSCIAILDESAPLVALADLVTGWTWPDRRAELRRDVLLDYLDTAVTPPRNQP